MRGPRTDGPLIRSLLVCVALLTWFAGEARAEDAAVTAIKQYVTEYANGQGLVACGRLTDEAREDMVNVLAPFMPVTVIKTGDAGLDCPTFLNTLSATLGPYKQKVLSLLPKVTFTVKQISSTERHAVMNDVEGRKPPPPVELKKVNTAWKLDDGFQGTAPPSNPPLAPLPAGYACLVTRLCGILPPPPPPPSTSCLDLDIIKKDITKLDLTELEACLPELCKGVPGIKDLTLTKPTDDIDGDGLSNAVELLLISQGKLPFKPDICKQDSDGDNIADAYDLIPGSVGKGLRVDVTITEIRQEDAADGNVVDQGLTDGIGDPWIADAVLSLGMLDPSGDKNKKDGKKIEFEGLTMELHPVDPPEIVKGVAVKKGYTVEPTLFRLSGGPVFLTEDVTRYPADVAGRFKKEKSFKREDFKIKDPANPVESITKQPPLIGLSLLFLDEDWGIDSPCSNEIYVATEPDVEACKDKGKGKVSNLLSNFTGLNLVTELFGAGDTVSSIARTATGTVGEVRCVPIYGLTACFKISISDVNGKPLSPCALGVATASWKNFTGKLGALTELPLDVMEVCNITPNLEQRRETVRAKTISRPARTRIRNGGRP